MKNSVMAAQLESLLVLMVNLYVSAKLLSEKYN